MVPELSIVIPTLNEAEVLPWLLADLAAQAGIALEVLVSDGGSTDGTPALAATALAGHQLAGSVLSGPAGRGRQLNRGAARARGEWLLFVHADSRLPEPAALAQALATLRREGDPRLAGRFALRFDLPGAAREFGYYLCEVKARLDLPGTTHGDQGILLPRAFFRELGAALLYYRAPSGMPDASIPHTQRKRAHEENSHQPGCIGIHFGKRFHVRAGQEGREKGHEEGRKGRVEGR